MEDAGHGVPGLGGAVRVWFDDLLDTTGIGVRAAIAGAALVGMLLGSFWWLTRQAPPSIESTIPLVDAAHVTTTTAVPEDLVVHVAGAVATPGVRRLPPGSRVVDAVEASGGLTADADPDRINLAALLVDASQIYVPRVGEFVPAGTATGAGGATSGPIDLNVADAAALEELPGVGPATAAAIIDYRERHGPFQSVEELLSVRGIGEAKLAAFRDLVRV